MECFSRQDPSGNTYRLSEEYESIKRAWERMPAHNTTALCPGLVTNLMGCMSREPHYHVRLFQTDLSSLFNCFNNTRQHAGYQHLPPLTETFLQFKKDHCSSLTLEATCSPLSSCKPYIVKEFFFGKNLM
jgi:hypothetical protein